MTSKSVASGLLILTALFLASVASSQTSTTTPAPYPNSTQGMSPEQLKIWNSPTMLRARAWVQEYCQRSAKITPEEANQYMAEMEHMTPVQMKLWLLKFQDEEDNIRQQQAAFNVGRQADLGQASGIHQAEQQADAAINRDETAAAQNAQESLNAERDAANERLLQKSSDRNAAATAQSTMPLYMGGYPYGYSRWGAFPAAGEVHYHVHYHGK
jgi:hypothetical protein